MKTEKSRLISEAAPQLATRMGAIFTADEGDISVVKFEGVSVRIVSAFG